MNLFQIALCVFLALFMISFLRDRRGLRNAVYLGFCLIFLDLDTLMRDGNGLFRRVMLAITNVGIPLIFVVCIAAFAAAGVIAIKKEGLSLPMCLSLGFGLAIVAVELCVPLMLRANSRILQALGLLVTFYELYFLFLFWALLLYSWLYSLLPLTKGCDYVLVHGAGLRRDGTVTPLLAGRLDKAIRVWHWAKEEPMLLVSGGQGGDEVCSEASAMEDYLLQKGIPQDKILQENRSTTTMENLMNAKAMMDERSGQYRCIFVTSDYHVFRTGAFAKKIGLKAEGVGSRTALYYWPNAFVREYVAILMQHKGAVIAVAVLWALLVGGYFGLEALAASLGV